MNILLSKFLISIKNTVLINKDILVVPFNKSFLPIIVILYNEGFILHYIKIKHNLVIKFRYFYDYSPLRGLKIISSVSKAIFFNHFELMKFFDKTKLMVLSTSNGIQTSCYCKKHKIGGEILFIC